MIPVGWIHHGRRHLIRKLSTPVCKTSQVTETVKLEVGKVMNSQSPPPMMCFPLTRPHLLKVPWPSLSSATNWPSVQIFGAYRGYFLVKPLQYPSMYTVLLSFLYHKHICYIVTVYLLLSYQVWHLCAFLTFVCGRVCIRRKIWFPSTISYWYLLSYLNNCWVNELIMYLLLC